MKVNARERDRENVSVYVREWVRERERERGAVICSQIFTILSRRISEPTLTSIWVGCFLYREPGTPGAERSPHLIWRFHFRALVLLLAFEIEPKLVGTLVERLYGNGFGVTSSLRHGAKDLKTQHYKFQTIFLLLVGPTFDPETWYSLCTISKRHLQISIIELIFKDYSS